MAGTAWSRSALPSGLGGINDVSCPTSTYCVAVGATPDGSGGIALTTENLGATWTPVALPDGEKSLGLVECASRRQCIAVGGGQSGSGEMLVITANGGRSWDKTSLPIGHDDSNGIACPSTTRCFVGGKRDTWRRDPFGPHLCHLEWWQVLDLPVTSPRHHQSLERCVPHHGELRGGGGWDRTEGWSRRGDDTDDLQRRCRLDSPFGPCGRGWSERRVLPDGRRLRGYRGEPIGNRRGRIYP